MYLQCISHFSLCYLSSADKLPSTHKKGESRRDKIMKVSMSTHCFENVPNLPERVLKRVRKYRPEWPGRTSPILGALASLLSSCYYSHSDRALESSVGHQHLWQMASSLHRDWILFLFIFQVHDTDSNMVSIQ